MDKLKKVIKNELESLTYKEKLSLLDELREEIDKYDKEIVKFLNKRTLNAVLIGRVKRALNLPTYSPEREKDISEKINSYHAGSKFLCISKLPVAFAFGPLLFWLPPNNFVNLVYKNIG